MGSCHRKHRCLSQEPNSTPCDAVAMTDFPLFETPDNPMPPVASAGMIAAQDGKRIRYACFPGSGPHSGTVVLLPGRNECIEKYYETAGDLSRRGFVVATFDWRGQGLSDRLLRNPQRGHIDRFDSYVDDLEAVLDGVVEPGCGGPFYLLAHSAGALAALLAAPRLTGRVRRMVLLAPLISLTGLPLSMNGVRRVATTAYWLGLGNFSLGRRRVGAPNPFAGNVLTSDERRYRRNQEIYRLHPELALGAPTASWLRAACYAVAAVQRPEFMARITMPVLFIAAGADQVVSTPAIERFARRLRSGHVLTIDGARHELLQERDRYREQLLAAFDAFVPGTAAAAYDG